MLQPSLAITKTADATPVTAGSPVGFTITVSNGGPGTATAVTVDDPLPSLAGVTWTLESQTGSACSITGAVGSQTLSCAIGDMASGTTYTVTSFDPTDYDQDIVWADGFFVRWPQKTN